MAGVRQWADVILAAIQVGEAVRRPTMNLVATKTAE